jgi:hypothetical protein
LPSAIRLAATALLLLLAACTGSAERSVAPDLDQGSRWRLEVHPDTGPARQVAVVLRSAGVAAGDPILAIQGTLMYDPARLRYLGQGSGTDVLLVNRVDPRRLRLVALALGRLEAAAVTLVFQVLAPHYTEEMGFKVEAAVPEHAVVASDRLEPIVLDAGPVQVISERPNPAELEIPALTHAAAAPGPPVYGDVNLDGGLNVLDVVILSRAVVGLEPLTIVDGLDQFLIGNVRPVNGGPGATGDPPGCSPTTTCRPGVEPGNSGAPLGTINVLDVVPVMYTAVGYEDPVVGRPLVASPATPPACSTYAHSRSIPVSTSSQLGAALASARPGDLIELRDGRYPGGWVITASGAAGAPIVLCGSKNAVLEGGSFSRDVLTLRASYWIIAGLSLTRGLRGVYTERASHNVLEYLSIWNLGQEAVHWRVFSSHNVIRRSAIQETGRSTPEWGEGVYIGSYRGHWCKSTSCQPDRSDSNAVIENVIGPDVTAESVDAKEGSTGGIIQRNTFNGRGMVRSQSWVDAWVEIAGNGYTVSDNQGSASPHDGFQVVVVATGWGNDNLFSRNIAEVGADGFGFRLNSKGSGNRVTCDNVVRAATAGFTNVSCR